MHIPVLMKEALDPIIAAQPKRVVDLTLGGGGYTRYLVESSYFIQVYAFDCDSEAIARARSEFSEFIDAGRVVLVHGNYSEIAEKLAELGVEKVDGIVADLGFSSWQMDTAERGFSFMNNGPLDMRLNKESPLTAHEIVNSWPENKIMGILKQFGEERNSKRITQRITEARIASEISTTAELASIVENAIPAKLRREMTSHPATKTFQALRIQVNEELLHLKGMLNSIPALLQPNGVASIVSFHSLEDRLVKQAFRFLTEKCICDDRPIQCERCYKPPAQKVYRQLVLPSEDEIAANPRSRSAKLRVISRTDHPLIDPRVNDS